MLTGIVKVEFTVGVEHKLVKEIQSTLNIYNGLYYAKRKPRQDRGFNIHTISMTYILQ